MDYVKYELQFLKELKDLFKFWYQKWSGDGPLKKKIFWTFLEVLKAVPDTFWEWVQKQKTNLDFQRIFDNSISKEFVKCIGYVFSYLSKSE